MIQVVPVIAGCNEVFGYLIEVGPPHYNAWESKRLHEGAREGKGRRYW